MLKCNAIFQTNITNGTNTCIKREGISFSLLILCCVVVATSAEFSIVSNQRYSTVTPRFKAKFLFS